MATLTSTKNGNWSDPTVWSPSQVPADGDTITVNHTVVFDANQSSFPNGVALTIGTNGKLTVPSSGGPYYLKASANVVVNGTLEFGTSTNPVPRNVNVTIDLNNARYITCNAGSNISIVCPNPTYISTKLTQDAASGATTLYVDRDLQGDWVAGDTIYIFGKGDSTKEQRLTVSSIGSNYITVTPALSTSQLRDSIIVNVTRNIKITQVTQTANLFNIAGLPSSFVAACWCDVPNASTGSYIFYTSLSNFVLRLIGGAYTTGYGVTTYARIYAENSIFRGSINGCFITQYANFNNCVFSSGGITNITTDCANAYVNNIHIASASVGVLSYTRGVLANSVLQGSVGPSNVSLLLLDNCLFNTTTSEISSLVSPVQYIASYNHNQVAGAFKSWSKGGITVSSTPPAGAIGSGWYKLMLTSANDYGFWQMPVTVPAGCMLHHMIKLVASKSMSYRARVQIIDPFADPLVISNAQPLAEAVLPEGYTAGSVYMFRLTWMNTDAFPKTVLLRVVGRNADGDIYFQSHRRPDEVMVPVLADCT